MGFLARPGGFEPPVSGVTGRRFKPLSYGPKKRATAPYGLTHKLQVELYLNIVTTSTLRNRF